MTYPVNAVYRTAIYGLLQHLVIVDLLRHNPGSAKVWLHLVCGRTHISTVLTTNTRQLVHKDLHVYR